MPSVTVTLLAALVGTSCANAHMTPFLKSMWNYPDQMTNADSNGPAGSPVGPIPPNQKTQSDWWFRGPATRAAAPAAGEITSLPAGGQVTMEIACHIAWTSQGVTPTTPGSDLDACPGNIGAYHTTDGGVPDTNAGLASTADLIAGCALGISYTSDLDSIGWDDITIFTVQPQCVKTKITSFDVPAKMPPCPAGGCICTWFWLANRGEANFYMTPFRCSVDGSPVDATAIAAPQDPVYCGDDSSKCVSGAKRPLFAYNQPTNVPDWGNDWRPGYHATWSFQPGAQNDIFVASGSATASAPATTITATATTPTSTPASSGVSVSVSAGAGGVGIGIGVNLGASPSSGTAAAASTKKPSTKSSKKSKKAKSKSSKKKSHRHPHHHHKSRYSGVHRPRSLPEDGTVSLLRRTTKRDGGRRLMTSR